MLLLSALLHIGLLAIPIASDQQTKLPEDPKTDALTKTVSLNKPQKAGNSKSRSKPKQKVKTKPRTTPRVPPRPSPAYQPVRPSPVASQSPVVSPSPPEQKSANNSPDTDANEKDSSEQDSKFAELQNQFVTQVFEELTASGGNESFGTAPSDFPQPEAFFTPASIAAYNPADGAIDLLPGIINAPRYHERVSPADLYPIVQSISAFQGFQFEQIGEYGGGPLYAAKKGKSVYYINLVKVARLGKGSFLVFWEWNPLKPPA
ncbi:MAG: hypothetical protein HC934_13510 [Acaryochloridaceae cyanobacterium SU_2_1]|nr:hypothetical protein [Acaryochloridaceae cyanobacterium SU_2_1]